MDIVVVRNEAIIQNNTVVNPFNIRYHSSSTITSNDGNNKNHKVKTLDELLEQVNVLVFLFEVIETHRDNI